MNASNERPISEAEVARVAREIWESEGRPEGRDQAHWHRAREIVERQAAGEGPGHAPRPVQPGFEDTVPGAVPEMKEALDPGELHEDAGGRFAKQLSEAPETPGRRSPKPKPSTGDPLPPPAKAP